MVAGGGVRGVVVLKVEDYRFGNCSAELEYFKAYSTVLWFTVMDVLFFYDWRMISTSYRLDALA